MTEQNHNFSPSRPGLACALILQGSGREMRFMNFELNKCIYARAERLMVHCSAFTYARVNLLLYRNLTIFLL